MSQRQREALARQKVLDDPTTAEMAALFEVDVDEYADHVLGFAQNPERDLELQLLAPEDPSAAELTPVHEVVGWFEDVAGGKVVLEATTGLKGVEKFTTKATTAERVRKAAGAKVEKQAPTFSQLRGEVRTTPHGGGFGMRDQLLQQRHRARMSTDQRRAQTRRTPPKRRTH